jgi:hypothetical protein
MKLSYRCPAAASNCGELPGSQQERKLSKPTLTPNPHQTYQLTNLLRLTPLIGGLLRVPFLDDLTVDLIVNRCGFRSVKSDGRL